MNDLNDKHNQEFCMARPTDIIKQAKPKRKRKVKTFEIIEDTREQTPLNFNGLVNSDGAEVVTINRALTTGDYSIPGYESSFAVERKSLEDLVGTLNPRTGNYEPDWRKPNRRFNRELERARHYDYFAIVITSTELDLLSHRYRSLISPQSIVGMLRAIDIRYGVRIFWLGSPSTTARWIVDTATAYVRERQRKFSATREDNTTPPIENLTDW